jgi:ketosteroid isomerase-like protein
MATPQSAAIFLQSEFWAYNPGMKKYLPQLLVLFIVVAMSAAANQGSAQGNSAASSTPDASVPRQAAGRDDAQRKAKEAIKLVLDSQAAAWNRGDLDGFMKGYWHSPELTFYSGGNIASGWEAALERYQRNYKGTGKEMGALEFQDLDIEILSRDAAMVTGKWQLTKSDGKRPHGLFTLIFKKMQPGWQIVHDHTSSADEK